MYDSGREDRGVGDILGTSPSGWHLDTLLTGTLQIAKIDCQLTSVDFATDWQERQKAGSRWRSCTAWGIGKLPNLYSSGEGPLGILSSGLGICIPQTH